MRKMALLGMLAAVVMTLAAITSVQAEETEEIWSAQREVTVFESVQELIDIGYIENEHYSFLGGEEEIESVYAQSVICYVYGATIESSYCTNKYSNDVYVDLSKMVVIHRSGNYMSEPFYRAVDVSSGVMLITSWDVYGGKVYSGFLFADPSVLSNKDQWIKSTDDFKRLAVMSPNHSKMFFFTQSCDLGTIISFCAPMRRLHLPQGVTVTKYAEIEDLLDKDLSDDARHYLKYIFEKEENTNFSVNGNGVATWGGGNSIKRVTFILDDSFGQVEGKDDRGNDDVISVPQEQETSNDGDDDDDNIEFSQKKSSGTANNGDTDPSLPISTSDHGGGSGGCNGGYGLFTLAAVLVWKNKRAA